MFYTSQNVFPAKEWAEIKVFLQKEAGRCLCIELREQNNGSVYHVALHFGNGDGVELAHKFQNAVANMEV